MSKIKTPKLHKDQLFFTSDLHFGHKLIAGHRGFDDVDDHDYMIVHKWNEVVKDDSVVVYILGDVSMRNAVSTRYLLGNLNGEKRLVRGNHDKRMSAGSLSEFRTVGDIVEIDAFGDDPKIKQRITLCHYQMMVWNRSHFGAWQLFGHSHGSSIHQMGKQIDVGVDAQMLRDDRAMPLMSYYDVERHMNELSVHESDHHRIRT